MLKHYRDLLELRKKHEGTEVEKKIDMEIIKEVGRLKALFDAWRKQFQNVLFYTDCGKVKKSIQRELFYQGLDPVEAVDSLLKKK